jgi:Na+:H+ antiporter, NhaC family
MNRVERTPSFAESFILVAISLSMLMYNIFILKGDAQIPLIIATSMISVYAVVRLGFRWDRLMDSIGNGIREIASTILIFGIIGMMIATWIMGGIVPTLVYYGLHLMNPKFFLVMTLLICVVVSTATGSSWTTVGTMGVVFLGIGAGFGIPMPITAGAAISGSYFGDKISPMSDTTNMAPAVSGSDLFSHIRHMLVSSGISTLIAAVLFFIIGLKYSGASGTPEIITEIESVISSSFHISLLFLIVPITVIGLGVLKMPSVPSLFLGVVLGVICCCIQGNDLGAVFDALNNGFTFTSDSELLSSLFTGGGIQNMMWSMSLTLCAICFGSVLEVTQIINVLAGKILSVVRGTKGLIVATVITCLTTNIITGDQYLGIILPGKMYKKSYEDYGLAPQNLSRALEDSATVTSPLVPWSSCAAVMVAALGIPTVQYLPYCFFCIVSPIVSIFLGITGITITKLPKDESIEKETPVID